MAGEAPERTSWQHVGHVGAARRRFRARCRGVLGVYREGAEALVGSTRARPTRGNRPARDGKLAVNARGLAIEHDVARARERSVARTSERLLRYRTAFRLTTGFERLERFAPAQSLATRLRAGKRVHGEPGRGVQPGAIAACPPPLASCPGRTVLPPQARAKRATRPTTPHAGCPNLCELAADDPIVTPPLPCGTVRAVPNDCDCGLTLQIQNPCDGELEAVDFSFDACWEGSGPGEPCSVLTRYQFGSHGISLDRLGSTKKELHRSQRRRGTPNRALGYRRVFW